MASPELGFQELIEYGKEIYDKYAQYLNGRAIYYHSDGYRYLLIEFKTTAIVEDLMRDCLETYRPLLGNQIAVGIDDTVDECR